MMSTSTKYFVLVAGNIGAGKTTLTSRLAERLGWETAYETVDTNPFLADFYRDMAAWAFHLQIYFLGDRAAQHLRMARLPGSAIIDRSIYEDAHIFARALYDMGNIGEREYRAYLRLFEIVVGSLPRPDLLIYLKAPIETLLERIQSRGRGIETGITAEYLTRLDAYYREWLSGFDACPVLTVPADNLNFVTNERHISIIVERILEKLAGKEEVVFPDFNDE
jgi:deoxyadenosine/deoxycytidine kinase